MINPRGGQRQPTSVLRRHRRSCGVRARLGAPAAPADSLRIGRKPAYSPQPRPLVLNPVNQPAGCSKAGLEANGAAGVI